MAISYSSFVLPGLLQTVGFAAQLANKQNIMSAAKKTDVLRLCILPPFEDMKDYSLR